MNTSASQSSVTQERAALPPSLADLSHEFKTPISVIFSSLQLLRMQLQREGSPALAEYEELLDYMEKNSYRLLRLASNLVDLSTNSEPQALQAAPHELAVLVKELVESIRPYAKVRDLSLRCICHAAPHTLLYCDRDKVERILLNLLSNAIKHTPAGGRITVTVTATKERCRIAVRDSGCGIALEYLPHLFEPLYVAANDPGAGSGLGLPIAKALAVLHGGSIAVKSSIGKGSTFTVSLPLAQPEAAPLRLKQSAESEREAHNMRVLLECADLAAEETAKTDR